MKAPSTLFRLRDYLRNEERFHFSKSYLSYETQLAYHHHDYYELFWVLKGLGTHQVNGHEFEVGAGDLIFIRPSDSHTFSFENKRQHLLLYNLAFYEKDVRYFRNRYSLINKDALWGEGAFPKQKKIAIARLDSLSLGSQNFLHGQKGSLQLDSIILPIFQLLTDSIEKLKLPYWFEAAVFRFSKQLHLAKGSEPFLHYCNRSSAHVNRTVKKYYGKTLTEFLNAIRLQHAKNHLLGSNKGIKAIAYAVGFDDVSYFHKLFKAHFGITPTTFRKEAMFAF